MPAPFIRKSCLALALLAFLLPTVPLVAQGGRSYSRCIRACNDIRKACFDRCESRCLELFPTDPDAYLTCVAACQGVCSAQDGDCKTLCKAFKDPIPSEP